MPLRQLQTVCPAGCAEAPSGEGSCHRSEPLGWQDWGKMYACEQASASAQSSTPPVWLFRLSKSKQGAGTLSVRIRTEPTQPKVLSCTFNHIPVTKLGLNLCKRLPLACHDRSSRQQSERNANRGRYKVQARRF